MRCDVHCPKSGGSGKIIAAIVGAVVLAAVWTLLPSLLLAAGVTAAVLAVAGVSMLVWAVRRGETLYRPHSLPALPATRTPVALPGGQPRALEAPRRVIPGVTLSDLSNGKVER